MIIARAIVLLLKVGFAVGCAVAGFMIFPAWYQVCSFVKDLILGIAPGLDTLMTLYLQLFPYFSLFLICLGVYIGFVRLLDSATSGKEGEE